MSYETFAVEQEGAVTTVAFDRPDKLNPLNEKVIGDMLAIVRELHENETARVVILTGHGRSFCVGADMKLLSEGPRSGPSDTDAANLRLSRRGWRLMEEWERLDQITIAAVNGFAVGGGLSLAMACDFRLVAEGARMWIPEVRLGVPYMWGSISRLIDLVGAAKAKELVMTCDEVSAREAVAIGLVNRIVPLGELRAAARALADTLLDKPPMALRRTKDFFRALHTNRAGDVTYADAYLGLACFGSEDMREAVTAFREQRAGVYHDR